VSEREARFAIREEGDGLWLEESLVVPYGEKITGTAEFGGLTEEFESGAFRDFGSAVIIDKHNGVPVSGKIAARETEAGWVLGPGKLLDTERAREFVALVREGVIRPSVEFDPTGEKVRTKTGISHRRVRNVFAVAGTYAAAYSGSFAVRHTEGTRVTDVIETPAETPPETPAPAPVTVSNGDMVAIAQRITDEAIRSYAARSAFGASGAPVDPFNEWRGLSLGQMAQRAIGAGEYASREVTRADREWIVRALRTVADTVTTSGANAGMVTPGVIGDVHGIVSRGRPAITAFGGPRSSEGSGLSIDWPYFDGTLTSFVGAQSAEKAEITSAAVNIKKGTEPLLTFAGGSDISYQLLRKATRPYLDAYLRILLTAWGVVTDAAFVTELESGSVTSDSGALGSLTAAAFKDFVIDGSIAVQTATGIPADFVLASTTGFTAMAKLFTPVTTLANTGVGTTDLRSLLVNVGGLPVIHVPSITAGKFIISNREAAAWYEEGPFQAQDEDVMHLGRDVAIWSMGAGARFIPAGIIELYDVP